MALLSGEVETRGHWIRRYRTLRGSGWLCYPGKLKRDGAKPVADLQEWVPDGFAIRGS